MNMDYHWVTHQDTRLPCDYRLSRYHGNTSCVVLMPHFCVHVCACVCLCVSGWKVTIMSHLPLIAPSHRAQIFSGWHGGCTVRDSFWRNSCYGNDWTYFQRIQNNTPLSWFSLSSLLDIMFSFFPPHQLATYGFHVWHSSHRSCGACASPLLFSLDVK